MTCQPIASGAQFLESSLAWLNCAGRQLGAGGYQALAAPGSVIFQILLALLTLFIAIQGLRLMFGRAYDMGDAALAAAKIGMVLMLATSWPAVRTLVYDTTVRGPGELVEQMTGAPLPLAERLTRLDAGMVALTSWGTGKLDIRAGRTAEGTPAASAFTGEALNESLGLSAGRLLFLVGVLGTLGLLALAGGALIALLPLFAGFLLFDRTRGIFWGWVRAVFLVFVSGAVIPLLLAIEAAMVEPWLTRVIAERQAMMAAPSAPIEMLALSMTFFIILVGSLTLLARTCFSIDPAIMLRQAQDLIGARRADETSAHEISTSERSISVSERSRAAQLASTLEIASRREMAPAVATAGAGSGWSGSRSANDAPIPLGRRPAGSRRSLRRQSRSSSRRDSQ